MKPRSQRPWIFGSLALLLVLACGGVLIWVVYQFGWDWTGFTAYTLPSPQYQRGKTLWDWLQLLIVPVMLAAGAGFFTWWSARTERQIAQQRYKQDQDLAIEKQREDLLQSYLDRMADLLLKEHLRDSLLGREARKVARTRTVSTLIQLDGKRARTIFVFLSEAQLIEGTDPILSFRGADLSQAKWGESNLRGFDLSGANLSEADLSGANLSEADLSGANLSEAHLRRADLSGANLSEAHLTRANLSWADLSGVHLNEADLSEANLRSATLLCADLSEAHLRRADLSGADLIEANLSGAHLRRSNMSGSDLRSANLSGADLKRANLSRADLSEADLSGTDLSEADLSGATLSTVRSLEAAQLDGTNLRGVRGLTPEQRIYCKAGGAVFDEEAPLSASPSPDVVAASSQEAILQPLPLSGQAVSPTQIQEVPPEAALSQKQMAVAQEAVPPAPISPAQENASPPPQGNATTSSSLQDSNGEKQPES